MSREVRRVPADWQHPKNERGYYIPLLDGNYAECAKAWDEERAKWEEGFITDWDTGDWKPKPPDVADCTFEEWRGGCPRPDEYMPGWRDEERTHYQMYESTSEGTPISPVFATPESLARWLADTGASAFADQTATYEEWLAMIMRRGSSVTAVMINGVLVSGVAAEARQEKM